MKRILLCTMFVFVLVLDAQELKRESYVDIPTAHYNQGLYLNLNGNFPIRSESEVGMDPNVGVEIAYANLNAILKWYNGSDFALDLVYQILQGGDGLPTLSIGIDNLTYSKFISPVGSEEDEIYDDEKYVPRPPEVASSYLVATKTISEYLELTVGVGRGKFVGYGPRSHLLNFDVFFDEYHENFVFGLFGGVKFMVPGGGSFILEADGRDANLGVQYETGLFKGTLALTKLDQFAADEGSPNTPRIDASLSFKVATLMAKKQGKLTFLILDEESGDPISGSALIKDGEGRILIDVLSTEVKTISVDPGLYMVTLNSPDYMAKQAKVYVKAEETKDVIAELRKEEVIHKEPEEKKEELETLKKEIENLRVNFSFDEFGIPATFYGELDKLIKLLKSNLDVSIEIGGHASAEGNASHNRWLSEARAKAVREYLVSQGIDRARLSVRGYGTEKPIASNATEEGRAKNRRGEFRVR